MRGNHLREFEELVLLSVRMNEADASGATIQRALDTEAGRSVSIGAIYTALERLGRKDLVESWLGDPTPVRGGRRKRHYRLTPQAKHSSQRYMQFAIACGLRWTPTLPARK